MAKSSKKTTTKKSLNKTNPEILNDGDLSINVPPPPSINKPIISDVKITSDVVKEKKVRAKKIINKKDVSETKVDNEIKITAPIVEDVVVDNIEISEIEVDSNVQSEQVQERKYEPEKEQESFMLPIEEVQRRIAEAAKGKTKEEILKSTPQPKFVAPPVVPPSPNTVFNQLAGNTTNQINNTPSETKNDELTELVLENDFSSSAEALELVYQEDKHFHTVVENLKNYLSICAFNMRKEDFEKTLPANIKASYYKGGIVLSKGNFSCKVFCKMNFY